MRGDLVERRGCRVFLLIATGRGGGGVVNESGPAALEELLEDTIFKGCFGGGMLFLLWGATMNECGRRAGAHRMQGRHGGLCGGPVNISGEKWQRA